MGIVTAVVFEGGRSIRCRALSGIVDSLGRVRNYAEIIPVGKERDTGKGARRKIRFGERGRANANAYDLTRC